MNQQVLKEDVRQFAERFELWEQLRGKTFLITGATGLIGSVMVKCLDALNCYRNLRLKIYAAIRDMNKAERVFGGEMSCVEFLKLNLMDFNADELPKGINYIVHLASPTNGKYMEEHPAETFNLAYQSTKSLLLGGGNFESLLYVSSLEYYGQILNDRLITEDMMGYVDPASARSAYPLWKQAAEELCRTYSRESTTPAKIARLTQTFGAGVSGNDNRVFAQFARSALKGDDIVLHTKGESAKPYCYTTDAVSAMLYILLKGEKGEAYNVANKDSYISIYDLAHFVQQRYNKDVKVVISLNDQLGYAPQTRLRLDTTKIEALGWHPQYNLGEMFDRLMEYLR